MNPQNLLKLPRKSLLPLLFLLLTVPASHLAAQEVSPTLVTNPPAFGTFYWLSGLPSAPYPMDPGRGLFPIWSLNGVYWVDDSELLKELGISGSMMMSESAPSPGDGEGGGGGAIGPCNSLTDFTVGYFYSTNGLSLGIAQTTNPWIALTIQTVKTNGSQDVFGSTNMVELALPSLSRTNWTWLMRANGRATNFSWGETNWCERYFQLGDAGIDPDNDGLSSSFEQLVSHSSPTNANSPRAIYETVIASQNPSNWFKLNDGSLTNAISGQAALTSTGIWDVDAFATGNNAVEFNGSSQRLTAGDVINGGTGTNQGSLSVLFRSLPSHPTNNITTPRYVFSQRGNITNELGLFFQPTNATADSGSLKLQIGGQTNILLASNAIVFGTWYYLAVTWNESNQLATWYIAPIGGTLSSSNFNFGATNVVGNSSNVVFGNRQNAGGNYTNAFRIPPGNGALDQIAFWNRELTAFEVNDQFNTLAALFQGPAKVFNLTRFNILLPINSDGQLTGTDPLEIRTGWLNSGFRYADPVDWKQKYFYVSNGNQMVCEAPWNGAKTGTSSGPRSELRETLPDGNKYNWSPLGTNTLEATCAVQSAGTNGTNKVIIGQFHSETATTSGPPVVISYNFPSNKAVTVTVKYSPTGSADQNYSLATGVNLGDSINYKLKLARVGGTITLTATVNGASTNVTMTSAPYDPNWTNHTFYFKAGCYYPDNPTSGNAKVTFSSLSGTHQ